MAPDATTAALVPEHIVGVAVVTFTWLLETTISCVTIAEPQALLLLYVSTAVPALTPVTRPLALILAIAALLVLHVPPVAVSLTVVVAPWHIPDTELIGESVISGRHALIGIDIGKPHTPALSQ